MGDPSFGSWVITIGYIIAAAVCFLAEKANKKRINKDLSAKGYVVWYLFAVFLLLLGINKQLDLQTLLIDVGRIVSRAQGWYKMRRVVQAAFALVIAAVGIIVLIALSKRLKGRWGEYTIAPLGVFLLIGFIVFRAGFIEHLDTIILHRNVYIPHRAYSITEIAGTMLIGLGALYSILRKVMQ